MPEFLIILGVLLALLGAWQAVELARAGRLKKRLATDDHHLESGRGGQRVGDARRTTWGRHHSRY